MVPGMVRRPMRKSEVGREGRAVELTASCPSPSPPTLAPSHPSSRSLDLMSHRVCALYAGQDCQLGTNVVPVADDLCASALAPPHRGLRSGVPLLYGLSSPRLCLSSTS